ncbi:carbohydrate ABC transporter permease [Cellulosilyticum sp. I15G10I2]|uniref:carbohydrate ABC transporter permease n=1 Tax=Cellulosilyticum sp. I15G10I2 TaxID=1892843 RepID=UPI00085C9EEE|nr:carbohydrate ABC transporter permease [Cellulosilyticum sp. I15G10I2]
MKKGEIMPKVITYIILILTTVIILYPLSAIFFSSFKTMPDFMANPLGMPKSFTIDNYIYAWSKMNFSKYTLNSLLITGISVLCISITGAMAGYKISRDFKGSKYIYLYFLAGMSIPTQSFIISLFSFLKSINMISSYVGMVLTYSALNLPFAILIFAGFFKTIPKDLLEAPEIDGCPELKLFTDILIPVSKPVFATVIIISGMNVWNDFFIQMIINMDQNKYTLPMGLLKFRGETSVNWTPLFASIMLVAIPIIIVFLLMQKQFIKGLTSGAVKG